MTDIVAPNDLWDGNSPGALSVWYVATGERVTAGQVICELAYEKAAMEVTSPANGVITRLKQIEEPVTKGEVIARLSA